MKKTVWSYEDYDILGRGRGVVKDRGRHLVFGDISFPGVGRNDPIYGGAFDLIPKIVAQLNKGIEQ